ncbi:MAG: hypothetical protein NE334_17840 [Lentisphaeraceae bacterium]|nr:hypothetical protein [Lentisphaeraceae bacterium]
MISTCNKIALFGDSFGIPCLLKHIPSKSVSVIIAASIRSKDNPDLKKLAFKLNVPFLEQPSYQKKDSYNLFIEKLSKLKPDLILSCSYSMILREEILETVSLNAVNAHASLLPKNRGPNPIQWSIIKGEQKTGVTLHFMAPQLDSGEIIAQDEVNISSKDNWVSLLKKVNTQLDCLWAKNIHNILERKYTRQPQSESLASYNKRLTPDYPKIQFDKMSNLQIYNLIRAQVAPLKGAYFIKNDQRIHIKQMLSMDEVKQLRLENE